MKDIEQIKSLEEQYQLKTYAKFPIALERGEGVYVFDTAGKRYLDFYGGHAVATTGHCHPAVVKAITEQASKLIFYSNIVYSSVRAEACEALVSLAPAGLTQVFLCNSGAEANETAIKAARKFSGKPLIISMREGFHGRTYGAMSITGFEKYRIYPPGLPGIEFATFGNAAELEQLFAERGAEIACVILEPVQSMAGIRIAPPAYYRALRELCTKHNAVLIFDEVQTGFGRTGANFFGENVGVTPDIITTAKGIASGVPMGATFFHEKIAAAVKLGEHGATFGGAPLACAAAKATVEVLKSERLAEHAKVAGAKLIDGLQAARLPGLKEIRGLGLLIGLEFETEAKPIIQKLFERGVITGSSEEKHTLRLIPPLVVNENHCQELITALQDVLKE